MNIVRWVGCGLLCAYLSATLALSAGCATVSNNARSVAVHNQDSQLLDGCEKLGMVRQTSDTTDAILGSAYESAVAKLRQQVYEMGGDTLVTLYTSYSVIVDNATVEGIAYKCDGQNKASTR